MSTQTKPGAKLRQVITDHISSDFRLHLQYAPDSDTPVEFHPHKRFLKLGTNADWAVLEGVVIALVCQLGGCYTGRGAVLGYGDLIRRVPGAEELYRSWESLLLRRLHGF
jgi:hypothetical protein